MVRCMVLFLCGVAMTGSKSGEEELQGEAFGYVDARVSYTAETGIYQQDTTGSFTLIIGYGGREKRIRATITAVDADGKFAIKDKNGAPVGRGQCHTNDDVFRLEMDDDYYLSDLHPFRVCKSHFFDHSASRVKLTKVFSANSGGLLLISGSVTTGYGITPILNWESLTERGENHIVYCWEDNDPRYSFPCVD